MKPTFNNKENKVHKVKDEFDKTRRIWESRSVAVVGVVLSHLSDGMHVLVEKRSKQMMDAPGKWCLPCGYLDWNESGWEALTREIYEETSVYLPDYENIIMFDNDKSPFFVNTSPLENRQNVAMSYIVVLETSIPKISYQDSEVDEVRWIREDEMENYEWAFNHDERIKQAIKFYRNDYQNL